MWFAAASGTAAKPIKEHIKQAGVHVVTMDPPTEEEMIVLMRAICNAEEAEVLRLFEIWGHSIRHMLAALGFTPLIDTYELERVNALGTSAELPVSGIRLRMLEKTLNLYI